MGVDTLSCFQTRSTPCFWRQYKDLLSILPALESLDEHYQDWTNPEWLEYSVCKRDLTCWSGVKLVSGIRGLSCQLFVSQGTLVGIIVFFFDWPRPGSWMFIARYRAEITPSSPEPFARSVDRTDESRPRQVYHVTQRLPSSMQTTSQQPQDTPEELNISANTQVLPRPSIR